MRQQYRLLGLCAALVLGTSACTVDGNAKYTGGGTLNSAGGTGKAVITINADTCGGNENAKGRVKYADRTAIDFEAVGGVAATATIAKAGVCGMGDSGSLDPDESECICEGWPAAVGTYVSTNPAAPGEGVFRACFLSTRENDVGGVDPNVVLVNDISFVGGPYDGYFNHGTMSGNIKTHACEAPAEG
ncbi:hypothetical protein [Marilutibacter maris]|uniref:Lipoprotein n=1 Tax=Marilutibacter maris TaxID=1605891 RepID=A0A2U9T449_9GAMM|nr:hypothetical protein [Lysobacter maris]AWV05764.1 hypothetical protein C9I47_0038 [Lysobacter maris]KAB8196994.1 hypothetical protein FKV24_003870 [Lysobacter maris]